ncbi:hypothetical protein [Staphylococcus phage VB-SauS-SA2]|nr:hypothetical protein [Staphylococcus phage VB-SauS-SA2]
MKLMKRLILHIKVLKLRVEANRLVKDIEKNPKNTLIPTTWEQLKKSADILKRADILEEKINKLR